MLVLALISSEPTRVNDRERALQESKQASNHGGSCAGSERRVPAPATVTPQDPRQSRVFHRW
eukprot:m.11102 g.11102  ORF g.11102 m.11102 type:complete len:62 (+) comp3930_c0_seq1:289-474(+)